MKRDAFDLPYLCTDATGVLVQAREKCRTGHFWVLVAPERHVIFGYSPHHDSAGVDKLLAGYEGYLVADAHSVYDHLYATGKVTEVACWAQNLESGVIRSTINSCGTRMGTRQRSLRIKSSA